MKHRTSPARALAALGVTSALAVGGLIGVASAAHADESPVVTITSKASGYGAKITAEVNLRKSQIDDVACSLDKAPISCGGPHPGPDSTSYVVSLSDLANGPHKVAIRVQAGGERFRAATTFTTAVPFGDPVTSCAAQGGTYGTMGVFFWTCEKDYASMDDAVRYSKELQRDLSQACDRDVNGGVMSLRAESGRVFNRFTCGKHGVEQMGQMCLGLGDDYEISSVGINGTYCVATSVPDDFPTKYAAQCTVIGGVYSTAAAMGLSGPGTGYYCKAP